MDAVTYVCLSDLHLGEEDSVLSNMNDDGSEGDPSQPGPVLQQLALCIKDLAQHLWKDNKPVLVLNGDALELALCPFHKASMAFQCFINQLKQDNTFLFEKVLLVPGNHDHHLWVMTREAQYLDYLKRHQHKNKVIELPEQWHSTKLFAAPKDPPVAMHYLTHLIRRPPLRMSVPVEVAYPNFGIMREKGLQSDQFPEKCVVFHHGHFTEWIYNAVSVLNDWIFTKNGSAARHAWKVEKENFAWIDFAWSALGQSWDSDTGLETVYEKALDDRKFAEVLTRLSQHVARLGGTEIFDWAEADILKSLMEWGYGKFSGTEKSHADAWLSPSGKKQFTEYVTGPLHAQILYEIVALQRGENQLDEKIYTAEHFKGKQAPPTTFVFGHTHKPYAEHKAFPGYSGGVDVYNSGGWIVETLDYAPLHGGSIVLVDEKLNVASIRMYNESADDKPVQVRVEPLLGTNATSPLADEIKNLNLFTRDPWKTFSQSVSEAIGLRRKFLRERVASPI